MTGRDAKTGDGKTIAVMQPYLFPYLGYFQLAHSVDEFWLLDTVNFIRRGWMNRNNLLVGGAKWLFTIPVSSGPRDQSILDKTFSPDAVHTLDKLCGTLRTSYAKAPYLDRVLKLLAALRDTVAASPQPVAFTEATEFALRRTFDMIGIDRPIYRVSSLNLADGLMGQERIVAVCQAAAADRYVNMIGGKDLYDAASFSEAGIELRFLEPSLRSYNQGKGNDFVPGLSIIDAIAWVSPDDLPTLYHDYRLVQNS